MMHDSKVHSDSHHANGPTMTATLEFFKLPLYAALFGGALAPLALSLTLLLSGLFS